MRLIWSGSIRRNGRILARFGLLSLVYTRGKEPGYASHADILVGSFNETGWTLREIRGGARTRRV